VTTRNAPAKKAVPGAGSGLPCKLAQVAYTIAKFIEENPNNPPVSQILTHEIVLPGEFHEDGRVARATVARATEELFKMPTTVRGSDLQDISVACVADAIA
jgi:hypothetical protein